MAISDARTHTPTASDVRRNFGFGSTLQLAFAASADGGLWVPTLEKAWAKLHGSYQRVTAGDPLKALSDLTGAPGWCHDHDTVSERALWRKLSRADRMGYLTTTCTAEGVEDGGSLSNLQNLNPNHAYTVLGVAHEKLEPEPPAAWRSWMSPRKREAQQASVPTVPCHPVIRSEGATRHLRLVKVRNPHGTGAWQGDWGEDSYLWKRHSALKAKLGVADFDRGTFFIPLADYRRIFTSTGIVKIHDSYHYSHVETPYSGGKVEAGTLTVPAATHHAADFKSKPTSSSVTVMLSAKQLSGRLYPEKSKYRYVPLMLAVVDCRGREVASTMGLINGATYVITRDLHCPAVRLDPEGSPYTVLARGCDTDAPDRRIVISAYSEQEVGLELAGPGGSVRQQVLNLGGVFLDWCRLK
jgi:calpain-15